MCTYDDGSSPRAGTRIFPVGKKLSVASVGSRTRERALEKRAEGEVCENGTRDIAVLRDDGAESESSGGIDCVGGLGGVVIREE